MMRKSFLLIPIVLIIFNHTFAQSRQHKQLDSLFNTLFKQKEFNGNVLIADKGKILFEESYGFANEKNGQKLNNHTIFELASVSKQFTAMGIVLLEKKGKLNYDDTMSKYIPELGFYDNISIRNLLNHTSGLPDYMEIFEEKWDKAKIAVNQDIVNVFAKYRPKLIFQPGAKFQYSDTGYTLLALIIERVSHQTFEKFLSENIFQPLNMRNTFIYRSRFKPKKIENYALGYVTDSVGNKVLPDSFGKGFYTYYLDGIVGDGTVNSTTEDLLKWDRALYGNKLIDPKDKDLIFNSLKTNDGKETNYGFGWFVVNSKKYGRIVYHTGGWPGYSTYIERHLDSDKTIVILQNHSEAKINSFLQKVRAILYKQ